MNYTTAQAQEMCQSQMRAIDDRRRRVRRHHAAAAETAACSTTPWSSSRPTTATCGASTAAGRSSCRTSPRSGCRSGCAGQAHRGRHQHHAHRLVPRHPADHAGGGRRSPCRPGRRRWTASRCCKRGHSDDDVLGVLQGHGQPEHPVVADGPARQHQVRPDLQRHRGDHRQGVLQPDERPGREHQPARRHQPGERPDRRPSSTRWSPS